jgi:hypothetical protein
MPLTTIAYGPFSVDKKVLFVEITFSKKKAVLLLAGRLQKRNTLLPFYNINRISAVQAKAKVRFTKT